MRCEKYLPHPYRKPNGEPVKVDGVWEVLLPPNLVIKIRNLARRRKVTMSWIVRYCIFQLLRRKKLILSAMEKSILVEIRAAIRYHRSRAKKTQSNGQILLHRLHVCFYGDDERWLRMAALELNLSVSMVIRIAIYRYLPSLENQKAVPYWHLFWMGIKFMARVDFYRNMYKGSLKKEHLYYSWLALEDFWRFPVGKLPRRLC